tara:strand:- start:165 stop:1040 length:876 start_codon:yes stop_codon:yes gene_type:complete
MSEQTKQEYVLHADGNFYKRTTYETLVKNQDAAVAAIKTKPMFHVSMFTPSFTVNSHGKDIGYKIYQACNVNPAEPASAYGEVFFVKAPKFYFTGAHLRQTNPETEGTFNMHIHSNSGRPLPESTDEYQFINKNDLPEPLHWTPAADGLELYFMFPMSRQGDRTLLTTSPYMFVYDADSKQSYAPNIPNVFDRGDICTGDGFPASTIDYAIAPDDYLSLIKKGIQSLNESTCNADLRRTEYEFRYLKFDEVGRSLMTLGVGGVQPADKDFYQPITHESILNFTSWLNNTKR